MSTNIHYSACPVCKAVEIKPVFPVKDYTVSGEKFLVVECVNCSLRFTQDVPDADSISPYYKSEEYVSHSNTSKGLINSLYQKVKKRTLRKKGDLILKKTGLVKGKILDMGSGTGAFVNEMFSRGWDVTGLEPDEQARRTGSEQYKIEMADTSAFNSLPPDSFDAITMWHVLEHVHELHTYIDQLKSLLKKNGRLFIAVPNYTSGDGEKYKQFWAAYDVPRHLYHFSPASMNYLMDLHEMKIKEYIPMWYDSFYISLLSSKYKNSTDHGTKGRAKLIPSFFNGVSSNISALLNNKRCSSVIYIISK